jgi:putative ABC transport system ATP-binding protein
MPDSLLTPPITVSSVRAPIVATSGIVPVPITLSSATVPPTTVSPATLPPSISLKSVGKVFAVGRGSLVALSGVDLDIAPGEVTAIMGPSGSGKTTLLSIVGCILRPTSGVVSICGTDAAALDEAERSRIRLAHIGFVFQSYNLFPSLSARQNVEIALELKGVTGRARREQAEGLLEQVGLRDKTLSHPKDLSGGQKQRVAIARALAGAPDIVLADEPTAALDSTTGRRIMAIFRELARRQKQTVVIVTHDSRILEFADRVVMVDDGRVTEPEIRRPRTEEPAALSASMIRRPRSFETAELGAAP